MHLLFFGIFLSIDLMRELSLSFTHYALADRSFGPKKRRFVSAIHVESGLTIIWASFILAISFLEAWVKFRAPFLRKHVAVDIGRHVFCALNTAEMALSTSFWISRLVEPSATAAGGGIAVLPLLPVLATASLWTEILFVSPKLYMRAKHLILGHAITETLNEKEEETLGRLAKEMDGRSLPSSNWHFLYVLLEAVKVVCLAGFVLGIRART